MKKRKWLLIFKKLHPRAVAIARKVSYKITHPNGGDYVNINLLEEYTWHLAVA